MSDPDYEPRGCPCPGACSAAAALATQAEELRDWKQAAEVEASERREAHTEIARLTRERDEAQAKERVRCARIAEAAHYGDVSDEYERGWLDACAQIAATIRGGRAGGQP